MENLENNKIFLDKEIFYKIKNEPFKWSDIKHFLFEDDDIIQIQFVEEFHSENNSWDSHFTCIITRKVLETDEEFQERIEKNERQKKWLKERRYKQYLELKKEFETPKND